MLRKWSWKSGADTQVCWSFHLHIKCYLVSYREQAGGGKTEGYAAAAQKQRRDHVAEDGSRLPVRQLALRNRLQFPGRGRQVSVS